MEERKQFKKKIVQEVAQDRASRKVKKREWETLEKEQKKEMVRQEALAQKESKRARKAEIAKMEKAEKKIAKKHDKVYRKVKRRPVRAVAWTLVLSLILFIVCSAAPIVSDMSKLASISLDSNTEAGIAARENAKAVAEQISDEGIVLLKNENKLLPLQNTKINVFGTAAYQIRYGGGGSGGADQSSAIDLFAGLANAGMEVNTELHNYYLSREDTGSGSDAPGIVQVVTSMMGQGSTDEPTIEYLTEDILNNAKQYSDTALIVVGSDGVEASDFTTEELKLTQNKKDLIDKVAHNFEHIILVVNAGNTMELGVIEEYEAIEGVIWIGTPGPYGCISLGNVIAGKVNPSGRTVDTYAYNAGSNPAAVNFGNYPYENIEGRYFINYNEGIYIGYRFYETYFEGDEAGYQKAVQFPFGYGLSYTNFDWETIGMTEEEDRISLEVKVTNRGQLAGKDVVQLYVTPPYTAGGIEKSAIELAAYQKTDHLEPGESQTVTLAFAKRDMSSYDMKAEAYVLEQGNYQIKLGKNIHAIVETMDYQVPTTITYHEDEATGTKIKNQFAYGNGDLTYLSRNDWENTYPDNSDLSYLADAKVVEHYNEKPEKQEGPVPVMGAEHGISFAEMKGIAYEDPKWQKFVDQFTLEEMKEIFVNGAYKTVGVERLGLPQSVLLDGPAGINSFFSKITAASYPTEIVIASSWNDKIAYAMGEAVGLEADAYGVHGWYAPGMNLHRTPQGGRNFEYFSEDPLLSGKMSASMVQGAQSQDILVFMKHFALNDQETNARSGIFVWANEQAMRELYLRPFEITVKEGKVTGAMSSFVHIGYKWCGGNEELLQNVLRKEWGFKGVVSTDAVLGKFMDLNLAVRYGNDLMLDPMPSGNRNYFDKIYKEDPVGVVTGLKERIHNVCYSLANDTKLIP